MPLEHRSGCIPKVLPISTNADARRATIKEEPELLIDDASARIKLEQDKEIMKIEPEDAAEDDIHTREIKVEFITDSDDGNSNDADYVDGGVAIKYEVHAAGSDEKFLIFAINNDNNMECERDAEEIKMDFTDSDHQSDIADEANLIVAAEGEIAVNSDSENTGDDCLDYEDHADEFINSSDDDRENSSVEDDDDSTHSKYSDDADEEEEDSHKENYKKLNKYFRCICPICAVECKNLALWYKHINRAHRIDDQLPATYTHIGDNMGECKTCSACIIMDPSWQAKRHFLTHQKYHKCFVCRICERHKCATVFTIRKHVQEMHIAPNSCIYCGKYQQNSAKICKHYMRLHREYDDKKFIYICPVCGKQFTKERLWQKHCRQVHHLHELENIAIKEISENGVEKFSCTKCPRIFEKTKVSTFQLLCHASRHMPHKVLKCKFCSMKFNSNISMRLHICDRFRKYLKSHITLPYMKYRIDKRDKHKVAGAAANIDIDQYLPYIKYACPVCQAEFTTQSDWHSHITAQHPDFFVRRNMSIKLPNDRYKCLEYPSLVSASLEDQQKHKLKHATHKSFICKLCGCDFNVITKLAYHVEEQHLTKGGSASHSETAMAAVAGKIYKCAGCELAFSSLSGHRLHFCNSHPYLAKEYGAHCVKCLLCQELFKDSDVLEQHISAVHASIIEEINAFGIISANTCRYCHRAFKTIDELEKHIKRKHTVDIENKIACPECGQYFSKLSNLRYIHWRWEHSGLPLPAALLSPRELQQREEEAANKTDTAEADSRNITTTNSSGSKTKSELQKKTLYYRNMFKTFKCVACDGGYCNQTTLSRHLQSEHPDIVEKYSTNCVKCLLCQELFRNRTQLEKHIFEMHANDYENGNDDLIDLTTTCPMCHLRFKTSERLEGHLKKKHTLSIYEKDICPECESYFPSVRSTRNHWLRLHSDKVLPEKLQLVKKSERSLMGKNDFVI